MELVTVVAQNRGLTEQEFLNRYTYRQIEHMAAAYVKDKMFVLNGIMSGLKSGKGVDVPAEEGNNRRRVVSDWLKSKMKPNSMAVDLDGPIESLAPFVHGIDKRLSKKQLARAMERRLKMDLLSKMDPKTIGDKLR